MRNSNGRRIQEEKRNTTINEIDLKRNDVDKIWFQVCAELKKNALLKI